MKATALRTALAFSLALISGEAPLMHAQSAHDSAARAPDLQSFVASRPSFEVASIKIDNAGLPPTGPMQSLKVTDGLFSMTNCGVLCMVGYAYNLTPNESPVVNSQLPKRMIGERFDVEARATGNPTEDEVRLMVQSLLAERFKFAMHYEVRATPLYNLILAKPGKIGAQLRTYGDEPACPAPGVPPPPTTIAGGFPTGCGSPQFMPSKQPGLVRMGSRNLSMQQLANWLRLVGGLDRSVVDRTGLAGNYDFLIEWDRRDTTNPTAEATGPTFVEALQDQLGLKLESETGPVKTFVVDHIEEPSPN